MKEEWLFRGALVPIDAATTAALVAEIKRLIDVVGGMALAQQEQEPVAWMTLNEYGEEDDIHYENPEGHLLEGWTYKPLYTYPPTVQLEKEPLEYWNAVEGWVKIDEVREHFGSVGCGTIYKTAGEDRVPVYTTPPLPVQERVAPVCERCADEIVENNAGLCANCLPAICTEQEPVAWMVYTQDGQSVYVTDNPTDIQEGQRALPLYMTPQQVQESVNINCPSCLHSFAVLPVAQRPWVGLTKEEAADCWSVSAVQTWEAIEAKLKEKNT